MAEPAEHAARRREIALAAATVVVGTYALIVAWTGGFETRFAGVRIRSTAWERPALLAAAGSAWLLYRARRPVAAAFVRVWNIADQARGARVLAGVAGAWTLAAGLTFGTFAVGGADSYGYVGQARLLLHGRVTDTVPWRAAFTWPDAPATLIPLGFTRGSAPGVIAPRYPPGLPLLMAPLTAISERAVYLLVPLFGVLAVWLTHKLGVELGDPLAGAVAAMLLSASPTFLYQLVQPMSDVPAMACWLGALIAASRGTVVSAGVAGALSSIAIMIRPNLAPLAGVIVLPVLLTARDFRWRRAGAFVASIVPGLIALAWIQHVRYGSALGSGYGTIEDGFTAGNIGPNLARYPRWLTESHTWFIWLSALAPFWIARRAARPLLGWTALLLVAAIWAAYLPYVYFQPQEWFYTRFLLPAIALMLFFAAASSLWALRRLPAALRLPISALLLLALLWTLAQSARSRDVFAVHRQESKYPAAGAFVREHLPPTAFILAAQHSGSIRYYAERPTLRWDLLDAAHLDQALASLRAEGYEPYAVLDAEEDVEFRRKFAAAGQRAAARLTPLAVLGAARVYGFDR
jgi:Dolichyl-phosphate-mannose-protein mannosyltransferase